jgi:hypothetical protein
MADEEKSIWDETPGEDYKFPDTKIPDQDALYPMGHYTGIVGRILPFWAGADGKKANPTDVGASVQSITQEIWITELQHVVEEKLVHEERIHVEALNVSFKGDTHHGVKILEFFPTEINPKFSKMSWKSKSFYDTFKGVIVGETGKKVVKWEVVKSYYGQMCFFDVVYNRAKGQTSGKMFRNISDMQIFSTKKFDAEVMARIESLYNDFRLKETQEKYNATKEPSTSVSDLEFP